jgi:hypothetical protein
MTPSLPPYVTRKIVQERLLEIFPEGSPARGYCTRDIAGATVFAMLYVGAVEGTSSYLAPKQVYRMSNEQAALISDAARREYARDSLKAGFIPRGKAWYADTTREPIRDETLRQGLIPVGAAVDRQDLPTTSPQPRYALAADFAKLFDPLLSGVDLADAMGAWRATYLEKGALARIAVIRAGASKVPSDFIVEFPNGETRRLKPGPSSKIIKVVVEEFTHRFLQEPAILWISESGNQVVSRDDILAKKLNLRIDPSRNLPDIILADLGPKGFLLVFVEVVATDGPVSEARREDLMSLAREAGFSEGQTAFVTAFLDRDSPSLRRTFSSLAWNSFVWFASEPDKIVALHNTSKSSSFPIHRLLQAGTD